MLLEVCHVTCIYRFSLLMILYFSGEAEAILARSQATAKGIEMVSQALKENGGVEVSLYSFLDPFHNISTSFSNSPTYIECMRAILEFNHMSYK